MKHDVLHIASADTLPLWPPAASLPQRHPKPSLAAVVEAAAAICDVPVQAIKGRARPQRYVRPRRLAIHVACEVTGLSMSNIGRLFGGRDHSTVIHHQRKARSLTEQQDPTFLADVAAMKERLGV